MKAATSFTFENTEYHFYIPNELVGRKEAKRECKNDGLGLAVIKTKKQVRNLSKFIKVNMPHNYYQYFRVNIVARSGDIVLHPSSKSLVYIDSDTNMSAANFICMRLLQNLDLQNDKNQTLLPLADQNDNSTTKTYLEKQTSSNSFFEEYTSLTCVLGGLALGLFLSIVIVLVKIYKRRQKRQNF